MPPSPSCYACKGDGDDIALLDSSTEEQNGADFPSTPMPNLGRPRLPSISIYLLAHLIAFTLYTIIFIVFINNYNQDQSSRDSLIYSPADSAINYGLETVDGFSDGTFNGHPNASSDTAWAELLKGSNVIIYPEEAKSIELKSLALRDGSGYVGSLAVYHELHCIKRIRQWFYYNYYYFNQTKAEEDEAFAHIEHCLETLRQSAMCHGDIAVRPFEWLRDNTGRVIGPTVKSGALHKCVDWSQLSAWSLSRRLDLLNPDLLVPADVVE
ncbi:hypothetical protein O1611_g2928 [Lasiodiplodia mahajangana]|uniref:Uncharacterized protein n=1 Tax=Lasiodiplodia mahajangana TaxID=1108764 RepID=A0ACC2JT97_9PEZI|nr:hypothetical protein O1611_g2928 [Lasiodiplodia mahajangana]